MSTGQKKKRAGFPTRSIVSRRKLKNYGAGGGVFAVMASAIFCFSALS